MDIKGTTRVCGLIGNPVGHSVSPAIHNNLARLTGKDMVYTTFKVERGDVEAAVRGAYSLNILGLNVTVPHKSEVIDSLVDIDPLAKAIGAVNTLVRVDGGFKGYNTDILGLARELEDEGIELADSKVIILGAGGAARAITFLCSSKGAKKIYLLNRSVDKAQDIAHAVINEFCDCQTLIVCFLFSSYGYYHFHILLYKTSSTASSNSFRFTRPRIRFTSFPSLKNKRVGEAATSYFCASSASKFTFTLTTISLSS